MSKNFKPPATQPWASSLAAAQAQGDLTRERGLRNPCRGCMAHCCWFLPFEHFDLETTYDLGDLEDLLGYEFMVAWLSPPGRVAVGVVRPCRHLNLETFACSLFGEPERPRMCADFEAEVCWYHHKRSKLEGSVLITRHHLDDLRSEMLMDDAGRILRVPRAPQISPVTTEAESPTQGPKVLVHFELLEGGPAWHDDFGDMLTFLSNFVGVHVVRSPDSWGVLIETTREQPGGSVWEASADDVLGSPYEGVAVLNPSLLLKQRNLPTEAFAAQSVTELLAKGAKPMTELVDWR